MNLASTLAYYVQKAEKATPKTPLLTVDCIILNALDEVLLIRRKNPPFEGCLALPGGFVDIGETVEDAVAREALEETNLRLTAPVFVGVYSEPRRDPRGHTVSLAYVARGCCRCDVALAGDDAASLCWCDFERIDIGGEPLAFDHTKIIRDAFGLMRHGRIYV